MAGNPTSVMAGKTTCQFYPDRQALTFDGASLVMFVAPWACNSNTLGEMRECYVMTLVLMILVAVERLVFLAVVAVELGA